jgi:DNA-cytosine methyltransferase
MSYKPYYLKDVIDNSNKELFTVISTFAGGGGSSTGYRLAGGKILCVNEFVEAAVETYKANYPNTPVLVEDIKKLNGEDFLKAAGIQKGELDILDGSPPCSAFSVAGKREKGWDQEKIYSDGKKVENIEDLFFEFIRIAKDIQPKVIIGENVAGILMGKAIKKYNEIINEFEKIGYTAVGQVLNAADYGTPQGRQRCFFVAIRNDIVDKAGLNFMTMANEVYPQKLDNKYLLKKLLTIYKMMNHKKKNYTITYKVGFKEVGRRYYPLIQKDTLNQVKTIYELYLKINGKSINKKGLEKKMLNLLLLTQIQD